MPRMADYWKTDKLFNLNCFREVMSRNRYMLIMRALHFSRNPERGAGGSKPSRLYKIDTVVEYFNNRMLEVYQPSKQLYPWRVNGPLAWPISFSPIYKK